MAKTRQDFKLILLYQIIILCSCVIEFIKLVAKTVLSFYLFLSTCLIHVHEQYLALLLYSLCVSMSLQL